MTTSTFKDYIAETIREVRTFRQADASKLKEWARVNPSAQRPGYVMAIRDQTWDTLANRARTEIRARRDDLKAMAQRRERIVALLRRTNIIKTLIKASGVPIGKRHDWSEIRDAIKRELQKRGVAEDRAARMLAQLKSRHPIEAPKALLRGLGGSTNQLNDLAQSHLTAMAGATLALAVALFNQLVLAGPGSNTAPAAFCNETEADVASAERGVWKALRDNNLLAVWAGATNLARLAASSLVHGALPHSAALALRRRSSTSSTRDGPLALRLGDLIRDLLRAVALGHYVAWLANWPEDTAPVRDWLRSARALPFPSTFQAPRTVPIMTLAAQPARFSGKAVTIEGVLGTVQIVHRGRKAISSAPVSDGKGKTATIVIPYIKLDSGGMVGGAYVRVPGIWQKHSKEVDGPALLIDRINLGELSRQSWSDWATAQLRPMFEAVPHGLAAGWSWEPGVDGAGNQLRYGTWFPKKEGRK